MPPLLPLPPGLIALTGAEGSGKTSYLRRLCGDLPARAGEAAHPDAQWLDLALPGQDALSALQLWQAQGARCPRWNAGLQQDLTQALALLAHQHKPLYMLSTGSRRKVALVGLLACGATVTCLDQPFAALDRASIQVLCAFLQDMAAHRSRSWVVADYQAEPQLPWSRVLALD
jgi:ABC-type transport system involved in cytochrome c biogenesis ATPase subunit